MAQLGSSRRWAVLLVLAACSVLLLNQFSFKFGISLPQNAVDIPVYTAPVKVDNGRSHWHDVPSRSEEFSPSHRLYAKI
jgi:hypothetical protein